MRHEYALVITCIFVVLWIPAQILLHNHRYNNIIRSRGYFFLFIQNIGTLISGTATGLYAGLQEDFDCYSYLFLSFLAFPLFCLPFFLRVWEYCVNFHISRVRAKLSVSDFDISERKSSVSSASKFPTSETEASSAVTNFTRTSWFCRHRWLCSRRFLLKYFLIGSWVTILPFVFIIAIQHRTEPIYFEEGYGCHASTGVYEVLVAYIFTFAATGIVLVIILRKARDTFHIKTEMLLIALTWLLTGTIYVIYAFLSTYSSYTKIPQSFIVLVSFFFSLFSTMIYPLILVYYHQPCKKRVLSSSPSFDELRIDSPIEDLVSSLQLPLYRNAFHKFLTMQFCAESLLFYETVVYWRNSLAGYSASKSKLQAQTIYNHFLTEEGICTVNVTRESVNLVEKRLAADDITHDLFEEPLKETINLMFTNSYYPFLKSDLYPKSKGVSFSALV